MTKNLHLSKANVKKHLHKLSQDKTDETTADFLSEGRIFFLGRFDVDAELFDRSQVVDRDDFEVVSKYTYVFVDLRY